MSKQRYEDLPPSWFRGIDKCDKCGGPAHQIGLCEKHYDMYLEWMARTKETDPPTD